MSSFTSPSTTSSPSSAKEGVSAIEETRRVAQDTTSGAAEIVRLNPVVGMVAIGVLGFAIGTIVGRSSVRRPGVLATNRDALQRVVEIAQSGAVGTIGHLRRVLEREGYAPGQIQGRLKQQIQRIIANAS